VSAPIARSIFLPPLVVVFGVPGRSDRKLFCAAIVASKLNLKVTASTAVIESDLTDELRAIA